MDDDGRVPELDPVGAARERPGRSRSKSSRIRDPRDENGPVPAEQRCHDGDDQGDRADDEGCVVVLGRSEDTQAGQSLADALMLQVLLDDEQHGRCAAKRTQSPATLRAKSGGPGSIRRFGSLSERASNPSRYSRNAARARRPTAADKTTATAVPHAPSWPLWARASSNPEPYASRKTRLCATTSDTSVIAEKPSRRRTVAMAGTIRPIRKPFARCDEISCRRHRACPLTRASVLDPGARGSPISWAANGWRRVQPVSEPRSRHLRGASRGCDGCVVPREREPRSEATNSFPSAGARFGTRRRRSRVDAELVLVPCLCVRNRGPAAERARPARRAGGDHA